MLKQTSTIVLLFALTFLIGAGSGYFFRGLTSPSVATYNEVVWEERDGRAERMRDGDRGAGQHQEQQYREFRMRMISELALEEEQVEPFFVIMATSRRNMRTVREENRDQLRAEMRQQADDMHAQVREVLSDEQFNKWMEMSRQYARNGGRGGN